MPPYLCVAQRISLYAGAHCCSWLPKCSGLNTTRHRATRRDTRISPGRDQHDSRDITLRGKRDAGAHANHSPRRGIRLRSAQYLPPRVPAGRRWGGGVGSDSGYWTTMAPCFGARFATGMDRGLFRNLATTRDRGACTGLDHHQWQYLAPYLMRGLRVYRYQHFGSSHVLKGGHARKADRCQNCAVYHAVGEQTDTRHDSSTTCTPACSAIVTDVVGRVACTTTRRVGALMAAQILNTVERQTVPRMERLARPSVIVTTGSPVCTTAGPQTLRHTYKPTAERVVSQVRKCAAP